MFIKKLGIAAVASLIAVSAFASNFRGADQVYVPIAGHAQGGSGLFISDVYISNLTGNTVSVSVIYVALGAHPANGLGEEKSNVITLQPYERKEFPDIMTTLGINVAANPLGQLIFNGCLQGADCGPATQDEYGYSTFFRDISVETRIYQIPTSNQTQTLGQAFPGIPWYNFVSSLQSTQHLDKVFITGFRQTGSVGQAGTFRSNIGLINASQYSSTTLRATLYQGTLSDANKKKSFDVNLGPLGSVQLPFNRSDAFDTAGNGTNFFVTVEQLNNVPTSDSPETCTQGCPAFLAYGSVLDNGSGDPTTLEAQYLVPLDPAAINALYPSGSGKAAFRRASRH